MIHQFVRYTNSCLRRRRPLRLLIGLFALATLICGTPVGPAEPAWASYPESDQSHWDDGIQFSYDGHAPSLEEFVSESVGNERFQIRRMTTSSAFIDVYVAGKKQFSVPDIDVTVDGDDYPPGTCGEPYRCYLSPDRRTFLVVRGLVKEINAVYMYRRIDGKMRLYCPAQPRVDDKIIEEYSACERVSQSELLQGARSFHFYHWIHSGAGFAYTMFACSYWLGEEDRPKDAIFRSWDGCLRVDDLRLSHTRTTATDAGY